MSEGHDAREIANIFIRLAKEKGVPLDARKLQYWIYFAQVRCLVIHGKPLIRQDFEAWPEGYP